MFCCFVVCLDATVSTSCSATCGDTRLYTNSSDSVSSSCFNFEMDCTNTTTCDLTCADVNSTDTLSSSSFPFPCFSAKQFYGVNTSVNCNGFCSLDDSDPFVTQMEYNDNIGYSGDNPSDDFELLENFAQDINGLHWSWFSTRNPCIQWNDGDNNIYYLSNWQGIECDFDNGGTFKIRLASLGLTGQIDLTSLPDTLEVLNLRANELSGSIQLDELGDLLSQLDLSNNQFSGSIVFDSNADYGNLQILELQDNEFSGTLDLKHAPPYMHYFSVSNNYLSGSLDFNQLTTSLVTLNMANNKFSGSVDLSTVSTATSLNSFDISNNQFSSPIDLSQFNDALETLLLSGNDFRGGNTKFSKLPSGLINIDVSDNRFTADIDVVLNAVNKLEYIEIVDLSDNQFIGIIPDLSNISHTLTQLNLQENLITGIESWKIGGILTFLFCFFFVFLSQTTFVDRSFVICERSSE